MWGGREAVTPFARSAAEPACRPPALGCWGGGGGGGSLSLPGVGGLCCPAGLSCGVVGFIAAQGSKHSTAGGSSP